MNNKFKIILIILVAVLFLTVFFFLGKKYETEKIKTEFQSLKQIRAKNNNYPLVNRLIGTEMPSADSIGIYSDAKNSIKKIISKKEYRDITHFSLYFRDLNTGLWFGINEDEEYIPASLFKVPIAISYFRHSLDEKNLFKKSLTYSSKEQLEINSIKNLDESDLVVGNSYTIEDLIKKMLVDSDNGAQRLLANNIEQIFLNKLYSIIEVDGPEQNHYYISPKEYAFFLRMLYNGSYLGLDKSEELLEILSKTTFDYGIKAGIPDDVEVINKFGSVNFSDKVTNEKIIGVHDCGIVYYTDRPYVLCIMTQGKDQKVETKIIEDVSKYLFKYITNINN